MNDTDTPQDRILIVEDEQEMGLTLSQACKDLGYEPVLVTSIAGAQNAIQKCAFPLAILDRLMPDGDSIEAVAAIRKSGNVQTILMVSALAHASHRVAGLDRGADDYLPKPFAPEELTARIRALMRRARSTSSDTDFLVFEQLEIRVKARTVHYGTLHIPLSPKEFELLLYFAVNEGNALSRMQLLENVWNLHFDPQTNVVDVHVGRLRRKLESQTGVNFIHTSRGEGYRFGVEPKGSDLEQ